MANFDKLLGTVQRAERFNPDQEQSNLFKKRSEEAAERRANEKRGAEAKETAIQALGRIKGMLEAGDRSDEALALLLIDAVEALEAIAADERASKPADKAISLLQGFSFFDHPKDAEAEILHLQSELEALKASRELEDVEGRKRIEWAIRACERRLESLLHSLPAMKKHLAAMARATDPKPILCRVEKKKGIKSESIKVTIID